MKEIAFSLLPLFLFSHVIAPVVPPFRQKELWQKSKQQRTIGWILLGTGTPVGIIGLAVASNNLLEDTFSGKENIRGIPNHKHHLIAKD